MHTLCIMCRMCVLQLPLSGCAVAPDDGALAATSPQRALTVQLPGPFGIIELSAYQPAPSSGAMMPSHRYRRGVALVLLRMLRMVLLTTVVHAVNPRLTPAACVRNPGGGGPAALRTELQRGAEAVVCGVRAHLMTVPANGLGVWRARPSPQEVQLNPVGVTGRTEAVLVFDVRTFTRGAVGVASRRHAEAAFAQLWADLGLGLRQQRDRAIHSGPRHGGAAADGRSGADRRMD